MLWYEIQHNEKVLKGCVRSHEQDDAQKIPVPVLCLHACVCRRAVIQHSYSKGLITIITQAAHAKAPFLHFVLNSHL